MHPSHSYTMLVITVTLAFVFVVSLLLYERTLAPSIGSTSVPHVLQCAEDEVISFVGIDTLDCVHLETLAYP